MISSSLICLKNINTTNLTKLSNLTDFIHFDIMEQDFSLCKGLEIELITEIKENYKTPLDVHIMSFYPEKYIDFCIKNKCDIISIHIESKMDIDYFINKVHENNLKAGLCITPSTNLETVFPYLDKIDLINVMTVNPGPSGQEFQKKELNKIVVLSNLKKEKNYNFIIEVDGSCNSKHYFDMKRSGTEMFVVGTSGLFNLDDNLEIAWDKMLQYMNKTMNIYLHADLVGNPLKEKIKSHLASKAYNIIDLYTDGIEEYPECAKKLSLEIAKSEYNIGLLFCGTGLGMSICANKVNGIRAAVVSDVYSSQMAKEHNDANVLCLGARVVTEQRGYIIVDKFLESKYLFGKHTPRVDRID